MGALGLSTWEHLLTTKFLLIKFDCIEFYLSGVFLNTNCCKGLYEKKISRYVAWRRNTGLLYIPGLDCKKHPSSVELCPVNDPRPVNLLESLSDRAPWSHHCPSVSVFFFHAVCSFPCTLPHLFHWKGVPHQYRTAPHWDFEWRRPHLEPPLASVDKDVEELWFGTPFMYIWVFVFFP